VKLYADIKERDIKRYRKRRFDPLQGLGPYPLGPCPIESALYRQGIRAHVGDFTIGLKSVLMGKRNYKMSSAARRFVRSVDNPRGHPKPGRIFVAVIP
jgi:hypothetical protein